MRDFVVITIVLTVLVGVPLAPVTPVFAEDIIWVGNDGDSWHDRRKWNPRQVPTANDRAIIKNNTRCVIQYTPEAKCQRIRIKGSGSIVELLSGANLILGDGGTRTSKILDKGRLELGSATLKINGDHTIIGDFGEIELQSVGARIVENDAQANDVLTLEGTACPTREVPACPLQLRGAGRIEVTLVNNAYVIADHKDSDLNLVTNDKSGDGSWIVENGGNLVLKGIMVTGGATWQATDRYYGGTIVIAHWEPSVFSWGNVYITGEGVGLWVQGGGQFCTSGNLEFKSVSTIGDPTTPQIKVAAGASAGFGVKSCFTFP